MRSSIWASFVIFLFSLSIAGAAEIQVPTDYSTIQAAISAAEEGDTIWVGPGTYVENIDFEGKGISVIGTLGSLWTVIDGSGSPDPDRGAVATFTSGEGDDALLQGFTLTNGTGNWSSEALRGGGVYCRDASPRLIDLTITGNEAAFGGGMYIKYYSSPMIMNCAILQNTALHEGGALRIYGSYPTVINTVIANNSAPVGGGIHTAKASPLFSNVTIFGNIASAGGGGLWTRLDSSTVVTNSILYGNSAPAGPQIYVSHVSGTLTPPSIEYSDVEGGQTAVYLQYLATLTWGDGMIDADPLFAQSENFDFHLSAGSPCMDSGVNTSVLLDTDFEGDHRIFNGVVDMGADEFSSVAFVVEPDFLSAATGGTVHLTLQAGSGNGGRNYLVLGSISGSEPGYALPGGLAVLPLNWDVFTLTLFPLINSSLLENFLGKLDAEGVGHATLNIPMPIPEAMGLTLHFAFALNGPWDYASNAVEIRVEP